MIGRNTPNISYIRNKPRFHTFQGGKQKKNRESFFGTRVFKIALGGPEFGENLMWGLLLRNFPVFLHGFFENTTYFFRK